MGTVTNTTPLLLVRPKNLKELKFISELLKRVGTEPRTLSEEEMEDIGLGMLMEAVEGDERVSFDDAIKALKE